MAITGTNTYQDYGFTGSIQACTVPYSGLYKIEVWGASGAGTPHAGGGAGGYAVGYKALNKNETLYIGVGGAGTYATTTYAFNGGGKGNGNTNFGSVGSELTAGGGGATHVALTNRGMLVSYSSYQSEILIVAGGGGGGYSYKGWSNTVYERYASGGSGGGLSGGNSSSFESNYLFGVGGSQTSGYAFGTAGNSGGGGWFGGHNCGNTAYGGGGGSGYTGGTPDITYAGATYTPSMVNGVWSGTGLARITLAKMASTLYYNGVLTEKVIFNGSEVSKVVFNGIPVLG